MSENKLISTHIMSYIEQLEKLECQLDMHLVTDLVLDSLSSYFSNFIIYDMARIKKKI
jgi:hypothetical protein